MNAYVTLKKNGNWVAVDEAGKVIKSVPCDAWLEDYLIMAGYTVIFK
jgi:hypothetical protein